MFFFVKVNYNSIFFQNIVEFRSRYQHFLQIKLSLIISYAPQQNVSSTKRVSNTNFYSAPTRHCDPLKNKFLIVCIIIVKIYFCRSKHTTLIIRPFFSIHRLFMQKAIAATYKLLTASNQTHSISCT